MGVVLAVSFFTSVVERTCRNGRPFTFQNWEKSSLSKVLIRLSELLTYIQSLFKHDEKFKPLTWSNVPVNSKTTHPPGQTPRHLTFLKMFGQIPRCVASLDGQMPHPLELQRGSNPPHPKENRLPLETSSTKFSATTNFLFSLSSLHTLKQRHIPRYNYIKRQQQKNPRGIDKSNDP